MTKSPTRKCHSCLAAYTGLFIPYNIVKGKMRCIVLATNERELESGEIASGKDPPVEQLCPILQLCETITHTSVTCCTALHSKHSPRNPKIPTGRSISMTTFPALASKVPSRCNFHNAIQIRTSQTSSIASTILLSSRVTRTFLSQVYQCQSGSKTRPSSPPLTIFTPHHRAKAV